MEGLIFVWKRSLKNKIVKALKKPVTYIYLVLGVLYAGFLLFGLENFLDMLGLLNPEGLVLIISLSTAMLAPITYATYAKRKGVVFRPSDVHFIFTAPVSPKWILPYSQINNLIMTCLVSTGLSLVGIFIFDIAVWKVIIYFLVSFGIDNALNLSLMVLLYGNETLSESKLKWLSRLLYLIPLLFFAGGVFLYFTGNGSLMSVAGILANPWIQCIPIIGWSIAFVRLLLLGPTVLNVICTLLYLASAVLLVVLAVNMKCTGAYYEYAMKFADDYQEILARKKSGDVSGKKNPKNLKKAAVTYKGSYAKAIFYRQLLEYKKNRFFVFDSMSLFVIGGSCFISYMAYKENLANTVMAPFVIPLTGAYLALCMSGYKTKWQKEMEQPLTYLIPDTPVRKLWYATLMEHVRAIGDGLILAIPPGIVMGLSIPIMIGTVLIFVCLQANKLYFGVLAESLLGNILGNTGKTLLKMVGQSLIVGIGGIIAAILAFTIGTEVAFAGATIFLILVTGILMLIGSRAFAKMEAPN